MFVELEQLFRIYFAEALLHYFNYCQVLLFCVLLLFSILGFYGSRNPPGNANKAGKFSFREGREGEGGKTSFLGNY